MVSFVGFAATSNSVLKKKKKICTRDFDDKTIVHPFTSVSVIFLIVVYHEIKGLMEERDGKESVCGSH